MGLNLSPREKILVTFALCLAIVMLWYNFLLQPQLITVGQLNEHIAAREKVLNERRGWAEKDAETTAAISRLTDEKGVLTEKVNTISSVRDLLNFLDRSATARSVNLSGVHVVGEESLTLSATATGYDNAREFIRFLEDCPNMRITAATIGNGGGVNFSLSIRAELGFGEREPGAGEVYPRTVPFN